MAFPRRKTPFDRWPPDHHPVRRPPLASMHPLVWPTLAMPCPATRPAAPPRRSMEARGPHAPDDARTCHAGATTQEWLRAHVWVGADHAARHGRRALAPQATRLGGSRGVEPAEGVRRGRREPNGLRTSIAPRSIQNGACPSPRRCSAPRPSPAPCVRPRRNAAPTAPLLFLMPPMIRSPLTAEPSTTAPHPNPPPVVRTRLAARGARRHLPRVYQRRCRRHRPNLAPVVA